MGAAHGKIGKVYFAQVAIEDGPIKIGFTSCLVGMRIASMQTGCPWPIKLLGTTDGTRTDEADLHAELADDRMSGEWFAASLRVLDAVERAIGVIQIWPRPKWPRLGDRTPNNYHTS